MTHLPAPQNNVSKKEQLAYKLMGYSVLTILITVLLVGFLAVQLLASLYLETPKEYQTTLITTPVLFYTIAAAILMTIALILAFTAASIAPVETPIASNTTLVILGWAITLLGCLIIFFVYTEKVLQMNIL